MDIIEDLRGRHLDEDDKIHFSINETARIVHDLNFGQRRFLAELVLIREQDERYHIEIILKNYVSY